MNHQDIKQKEYDRSVEKFAEGTCKPDESSSVIRWIKDSSHQKPLQHALKKLWQKSLVSEETEDEELDLQAGLDKIHHRINLQEEGTNSGLQRSFRINRIFLRVAAVLFIPLLITSFLYLYQRVEMSSLKDQSTELSASYGSKLRTQLPDGTTVWLNSGSILEYSKSFTKNRFVKLTGEAYFDVVQNKQHPFIVKTDDLDIIVTGTRFNVMAYPEQNTISATLEEGRIEIETQTEGKKSSPLCFLELNERMVFKKEDKTFQKSIVQTELFTSWKDGKLVMSNHSLALIFEQLERRFNTEIEVANKGVLLETPYTITIENETIEQVIKYLSIASGFTYEEIPAQLMEDGRTSKRKYLISN